MKGLKASFGTNFCIFKIFIFGSYILNLVHLNFYTFKIFILIIVLSSLVELKL